MIKILRWCQQDTIESEGTASRDGRNEDKITNPKWIVDSQLVKPRRNQRMYQSIRASFSFIVPGGVLRFINSATMAKTQAVKGRFM